MHGEQFKENRHFYYRVKVGMLQGELTIISVFCPSGHI